MKSKIALLIPLLAFALTIKAQNPSDAEVTSSLQKMLKTTYGNTPEDGRKFFWSKVDLNDDGKNEYLVGLTGMQWCGRGCTMLVVTHNFKVNTKMTLVNFPVYVGAPGTKGEVTKGYADIYINVTKGLVKMSWNGSRYPGNPSMAPLAKKGITNGKFALLDQSKLSTSTF